jgi:hypothetical protein
LAVAASRAASLRAETSNNWCEREAAAGSGLGASSTITCTLVPPMPNELTPARRGWSPRGHGRSSVFTKNGLASKSISGLGSS